MYIPLKGALCSFGEIQTQIFFLKLRNIYFFHNWINKMFSKENKVTRTLSEARKVAGSAKYKQVQHHEIMLSFKDSLFIQS